MIAFYSCNVEVRETYVSIHRQCDQEEQEETEETGSSGEGTAPSCASFFFSCSLRHHCPPRCMFLCANLLVLAITFVCLHICGCKCKGILSKEKIPSCFSSHVHTTFFLHKMIHLQRGSDIQSHSSYTPVISHHSGGAEEPITL